MSNLLWIGVGGFLGSILRYLFSGVVQGAFTVETRAFLFIGLLGGFTTFSTFGNETMNLFRTSESLLAFLSLALHVVLGLGAVWLGPTFAFLIWR